MSAEAVEIVGGGLSGLRRATDLARGGASVTFVEPELRAGGRFVTESFLTPFRFNLGPALVPRHLVAGVDAIEPDPLVAVAGEPLGRQPLSLAAAGTVWETLDANDLAPARGTLLAALAVLLGLDPDVRGSGAALARTAARLDDLVAVRAGNGAVAARLLDELVAHGGRVIEGVGPERRRGRRRRGSLGTARLFVGLRGRRPAAAFATGVGFDDLRSLRAGLDALRDGATVPPLGFLVANDHLDPTRPGDPLTSLVWQGVLPESSPLSREEYTAAVLAGAGVEPADVVFALLWLPEETHEPLGAAPTALRP